MVEQVPTVNLARDCFSNKRDFLRWATSTFTPEDKKLITIHTNLSAILRALNGIHKLEIGRFKCFTKVLMSIL